MGEYKEKFELEFTKRTLEMVKNDQYHKGEYEVTSLVNHLLGLIAVPSEYIKYPGNIRGMEKNILVDRRKKFRLFLDDNYGGSTLRDIFKFELQFENEDFCSTVYKSDIKQDKFKGHELLSVNYVEFLRLIRNGIAHGQIELYGEKINKIRLENYDPNKSENNKDFSVRLDIEDFKKYTIRVAEIHIDFMELHE